MSLAIDVTKVRAILLADGWHRIAASSLVVGAYEFLQHEVTTSADGHGVIGYQFTDDAGYVLCGPVSAILASRMA
jgi:hypothetical protein